ncbi:serine hydrolase [Marinicella meishanensis]|uniref:serine hydrolase n=1 Tax=Marinicella meishanensis TaxID=2873263 RepID=UPI001CBFE264|nr:serine hydrolase [Marinicella sp. NBU2979]
MKKTLLLGWLMASAVQAEIPANVQEQINLRVQHGLNPSIVIGVYEHGQSVFHTAGWQDPAQQIAATTETVYEIGSISKTFTALLLAIQAEQHDLSLDAAVQDHWPAPLQLVDAQQQAITFKQLATHTSGLPRIPGNLMAFGTDPYAQYDRAQLLKGVSMAQPQAAGTQYAYSNFGAGLLGESLAVMQNTPYNQLVSDQILKPLGLQHTYMTLDAVPEAHLAQGHNGNRASQAWNFAALAGAGSIRSDIRDLLAYGVAHLSATESPLQAAMDLATAVHYEQGQLQVGLGWHFGQGGIIWHNGGTGGFRSMLMIDPKNQRVVAGITNSSNNDVEDIVAHLMNPDAPMRQHDFPVPIEASQLDPYLGQYRHQNSDKTLRIERKNDRLFMVAPKQPRYAMTHVGDHTFTLNLAKVKMTFDVDDNGQVNQLQLIGWGEPQTYGRIDSE